MVTLSYLIFIELGGSCCVQRSLEIFKVTRQSKNIKGKLKDIVGLVVRLLLR